MNNKDHLMEILGNIDQINVPIDLEGVILKTIQERESSKVQIARYKANGFKSIIVSGILIVVLGILFSLPSSVRTVEHSIVTYTSIIITLLVIFILLEMGKAKIFDNLENNLS